MIKLVKKHQEAKNVLDEENAESHVEQYFSSADDQRTLWDEIILGTECTRAIKERSYAKAILMLRLRNVFELDKHDEFRYTRAAKLLTVLEKKLADQKAKSSK